jgi:hypothetical protein
MHVFHNVLNIMILINYMYLAFPTLGKLSDSWAWKWEGIVKDCPALVLLLTTFSCLRLNIFIISRGLTPLYCSQSEPHHYGSLIQNR